MNAVRCEACELEAARMAYHAGLGASEWEAFIHHVPPCDECRKVAVLLGNAVLPSYDVTELVEFVPRSDGSIRIEPRRA